MSLSHLLAFQNLPLSLTPSLLCLVCNTDTLAFQVLDVVAESVGCFDEVNVATALHRLAKLQPPNSGGQASLIIYADHFQQLVLAIKRQLHCFEAQAVSNTLWGE